MVFVHTACELIAVDMDISRSLAPWDQESCCLDARTRWEKSLRRATTTMYKHLVEKWLVET